VNQNGFKQMQINLSGLGCWIAFFGVIWLLGAVGLGWLVRSLAVLVLLIMLAPVLLFLGFRFWLKRSLVQADCPVCTTTLTGIKGTQTQCPNCGTLLKADGEGFHRLQEEGTIDVTAVDVTPDPPSSLPEGEQR